MVYVWYLSGMWYLVCNIYLVSVLQTNAVKFSCIHVLGQFLLLYLIIIIVPFGFVPFGSLKYHKDSIKRRFVEKLQVR